MKNFRYVEKTSAECKEDSYLAILYLSRVELHCKLQEKLHRVNMALRIFLKNYRVTMTTTLDTSCSENTMVLSAKRGFLHACIF